MSEATLDPRGDPYIGWGDAAEETPVLAPAPALLKRAPAEGRCPQLVQAKLAALFDA